MMRRLIARCGASIVLLSPLAAGQETHDHPAPERLGTVVFDTTCAASGQKEFERAVALLHSFAYSAAEASFKTVAAADPQCAIARWGMAMTHFHQLWEPPLPAETFGPGQQEIREAEQIKSGSEREHDFVSALAWIYDDAIPYPARLKNYVAAMQGLAAKYPNDSEAEIFYALALLASASPFDKSHANQKQATAILEPLYRQYPQHPGIAHYLIHAYDNAELATRGVAAARAYAKIAPSAAHALHMPSHIFTRLGMWSDSIESNKAAEMAAHDQGDVGEELHAMDYLVYAYLQEGRDSEADAVLQRLSLMQGLSEHDFKVAYASTAMPVRYAVERGQWADAARIEPPEGAPPHVVAVAVWARALGLARGGRPGDVPAEIEKLNALEQQLRASGNAYWAKQVAIERMEAEAWLAQALGDPERARDRLRAAADEEDAVEKLPVTPGPIVPAREQLGELLLEQNRPDLAIGEFKIALVGAPNRRGSLVGLSRALARPGH